MNNSSTKEKPIGESNWLTRSKPAVKWAVVLLVFVFLVLTVRKAYSDVLVHREHLDFSAMDWRWLLIGVLVYMAGMLPASAAWLQTLRAFGQSVPLWVGLHAYFLGHLGKYVPGKAMVIVLRVGRLAPLGIEIKPTIASIFVETLTSMAVGAMVGSIFIFFAPEFPPRWMVMGAAICIPCSFVLLLPHTFRALLAVLAKSKIGRMPRSVSEAFTGIMMLRTCAWMSLGWMLHGTAGWLVLSGIQSTPGLWTFQAWAACVSAVSLGAVVGFASMLPSGAVVRELVITWLLSSVVPQPIALFAAIAFRIANLIAEFIIVGVISLIKHRAAISRIPIMP
ncbi:MAG TPA: lysylphosphatidylglycerol synthase domain-containing protein [Pirellula sp.]|nr:lysylphosphatidylglycerol synthase domain-containing protein [Pirellula sp.]